MGQLRSSSPTSKSLFDARLALDAFELYSEKNFKYNKNFIVIKEKLIREIQERSWDHVFYVHFEDYKDELGIDTILPPERKDYVVSTDQFDCVYIKVLKKFGVKFHASWTTGELKCEVGRFVEKQCGR